MNKTVAIALGLLLFMGAKKTKAKTTTPEAEDSASGGSLPRGLRNNNVGNLMIPVLDGVYKPIGWKGEKPLAENTDKPYSQFYEKKLGTRAMMKQLLNYHDIKGLRSIKSMVKKYAIGDMPMDAGTENYINFVSDYVSIPATNTLTRDKGTFSRVIKAMARFENGMEALTLAEAEQSWEDAKL